MISKHLSEPWFSYVEQGKKTIEGRLEREEWSKIKPGDIIEFYNSDTGSKRAFQVKVVDIKKYSSFKSLINTEGLNNILPGVTSLEEGIKIYEKIYGSTPNHNILGIKLQKL
ncbi:Archaea-specific enzyme related to ProFAR isomerase, putative [Trichomonas vaginalis G3]|uniref:Archaea-specific enzyme related to ProFAR isomerase, putative n=1 Tax=Trichomonas vaginalis (strain ATCC PRA-98 / G3) TaxID=412133 RepID=A2DZ51_TRIV3|nr:asch pf0470 like domain-containing protein [Trichomonas vaginalis G3]EAY14327.1 Archaea-specific enzyme related to ProFAR isomerase, putative [Trichomonas vaginalis G3]KAI5517353.1 asch pf0470 like domain-containing protein [Trichomonas vaginalis G3]|eukprot:XP_001326550.1 Archaea-specific enzyme related to ProFAR isomerase [Trichomonas vaginalis G3]